MATAEPERLRARALWLSELGLDESEPAPVAIIEEVANGCLALLEEVDRLKRDRAEARAWAWSEFHRQYDARWLPVAEVPGLSPPWDWAPPEWLSDVREPPDQDWWSA